MKKHNVKSLVKNKGFYVLLFVGLIAIAAVTTIGVRVSRNDKKNNLVDLNTPNETNISVTENTDTEESSDVAINTTDVAQADLHSGEVVGDYTNEELLEYDAYNNETENEVVESNDESLQEVAETTDETAQVADVTDTAIQNDTNNATEDQSKVEDSVSVMQPSATSSNLSFSSDSTMSWPVVGNIIMNYKTDGVIYYATLGEWKYNPAVVISSEVGTEVKAATKGAVSSVTKDDELGTVVTMDVGNDYQVVYGQLKDVSCKVGDVINKDAVFGKISDPTKYYSVEGSNLYLQVLHNGEPVNPMLFLSGEE